MPKFRKKPVVVEAVRVADAIAAAGNDWPALPGWLRDAYEGGGILFTSEYVSVQTLEGVMRAAPDHWLICGVAGEVYPCNPDIFAATYELVPDRPKLCGRCDGRGRVSTNGLGSPLIPCPYCSEN